jgi:hypothetical protein
MNPSKCDDPDYIDLLITARKVFTYVEAAGYQPMML